MEIWRQNSAVLCGPGVLLDCYMESVPQVLMESIEVISILLSHIGANIIDPDLKPGVISFICKEGGFLCSVAECRVLLFANSTSSKRDTQSSC